MRLALHGLTILASAFLLFAIEPLAGKALLPLLGGVPGAWTACLLFFQAALLASYGYVRLGAAWPPRLRVAVHAGLLALALLPWPPFGALGGIEGLTPSEAPVLYALAFLARNVGLAFVALGATSPLLSSWYAESGGGRPYSLYAASNAGSLGALLLYPTVVEPLLDLRQQAAILRAGLWVVSAGVLAAGLGLVAATRRAPPRDAAAAREAEAPPTWARCLRWAGLAFVPSALLAGSTATLTTDLAPLPLLWVLPLAIYLASFILAFGERVGPPPPWLGRAACLVALVLVLSTVTHANRPVLLLSALHLLFLGAGSWIAHRRLAEDAPHPRHLPGFFVWVALGGALGTLASAVVAPAVLPDLFEYPAAIALACLLRRRAGVVVEDGGWRGDLLAALAVPALVLPPALLAPRLGLGSPPLVAVLSFGPAALYAYRWMPRRRRYTLCLLALLLSLAATQHGGERRLTRRSFFGVLRVVDDGEARHLLHGTTLHGTQRLDQRGGCVPLAYYAEDGPLGSFFEARRAARRQGRVLAVGLGAGAVACYARPRERWRIQEIDPDVVEVASDPEWFTFLRNSPGGSVEVTLGDGRVGVREEADASLSLILVDAFNSDAVPTHLLTREAVRLYVRKLEPRGQVLLHLSNRLLDLPRVVADVVAAEGLAAVSLEDEHASYAALARRPEDLEPLVARGWRPLEGGDAAAAWTDAFSSLFSAIDL